MRLLVLLAALALGGIHPAEAKPGPAPAREQRADAFTLIEGSYQIVGAEPDGDSVRFHARDPADWRLVARLRSNKRGGVPLRLDGIDALETHYGPRGGAIGQTHQPFDLARAASAELVRWLGFTNVQRRGERVVAAQPDRVAGYVLVNSADAYGRAIAFAFRGEHPGNTGDRVSLEALYKASLNRHLLAGGFAYPTFYASLPAGVRGLMARDAAQARARRLGIWAKDRTSGFTVPASLTEAQDQAFVFPKLFRRLVDYVAANGNTNLDGFAAYLGQRRDRVLVDGRVVPFASLVSVDGQTLRLTRALEELVFQDD